MVMRAKVMLIGSNTHTGNGMKFTKNQPKILTNPSDIRYYQNQSGFLVTLLEEPKTKIVTEKYISGNENEDEMKDETEEYETEDEEDETEDEIIYTEEGLDNFKKIELKNIAASLGLDVNGTKKELIDKIMEAQ